MKQFNLEEYLKNQKRKVITRDGRNVRIICTDRQGGDHPILILCSASDGTESCFSCFPNGRRYVDTDSCVDLFFAPEKREGWVNLYKGNTCYFLGSTFFYQSASEAISHVMKNRDYIRTIKIEWEE